MTSGPTPLQGIAELEAAIEASHERPVLLFKHSYTCGISAEALDELKTHIVDRVDRDDPSAVSYAMVTVQTHRDLSNVIAERLGVRHETPQAILVREGRAVWSASHFRVNAAELQKALAGVAAS